ncbi:MULTISPECIES: hypothetical protein [Devosia]|uniref:Uncharacterized protein n=1 Tax=Devosia equisanguinis TaxID=2490941 RepID=A0A3S4CSI0_9HYPH|nr:MULTISPECIES: hypothetical protein [Devosia]ODT51204.1 MAG: hypothetical protein ABS74_00525 [Pelagibacterium sp. SCN 63-126]ODU84159.1 MAG: hypothetical protein ABT14_15010 [Pelagibacterium sp. SCN 63-17]OJX41668.1 MAG: hypothetical protein BGO80_08660 [Devosia sp. 63-57]VDS04905.1 hypothetical protein DEVEQU_02046 [Devosia equisanguinis]
MRHVKASDRTGLKLAHWHGRSGRDYDLIGESFSDFSMNAGVLYLISKGGNVLWVGSTEDLVSDPMSRTRFRLALDCADRVFRLATDPAEGNRLSTIWDLEGAMPLPETSAQAA